LRRHQTSIVAQCFKLATEMMRTDAGLHADQARRHVGKACGYLATRPLLMQHDRAALIVAHDVERVLTDINADYGDCGIELLRHGVLLVFGAPGQLKTLAGQEPGRTIPLAVIGVHDLMFRTNISKCSRFSTRPSGILAWFNPAGLI